MSIGIKLKGHLREMRLLSVCKIKWNMEMQVRRHINNVLRIMEFRTNYQKCGLR